MDTDGGLNTQEEENATLAEVLESNLILCDYCQQVYHHPLLLPCLHTFCADCVVAMVTKCKDDSTLTPSSPSSTQCNGTKTNITTDTSILTPSPPTTHNNSGNRRTRIATARTSGNKIVHKIQLQCPTCLVPVFIATDDKNDNTDGDDNNDYNDNYDGDHDKDTEDKDNNDGDNNNAIDNGVVKKKGILKKATTHNKTKESIRKNATFKDNGITDANKATTSKNSSTQPINGTSNSNHSNEIKNGNTNHTSPRPLKQLNMVIKTKVLSSLPMNNFLDSLTRLYRHRNDVGRLCAYCLTEEQKIDASCLCLQCNDNLCLDCASAHRKTRLTREHRVVPFEAIAQGLYDHDIRNEDNSISCLDHTKSTASHFCNDCLVVACKSCRSGNHYGHDLVVMKEATKRFLPEIVRIHKSLTQSCPSLTSYAHFLTNQLQTLTTARDTTVEDIHRQTRILVQMIEDRKESICKDVEKEYLKEKSTIETKIADVHTSKRSAEKSALFLRHLANLGKAEEQMSMYGYVTTRTRELLMTAPKVMRSRLNLSFYPGPTTKANVAILMGKVESKLVDIESQDKPKINHLLSHLMPTTLSPPILLSTITLGGHFTKQTTTNTTINDDHITTDTTTTTTTNAQPVYPSGIDIRENMLAVVDRENTKVYVFDLSTNKLLKEIDGTGKDMSSSADTTATSSTNQKKQNTINRFRKPFDVAILQNGILAVTDPEAMCIWMFEWTGKFVGKFGGDMKHPRGISHWGNKRKRNGEEENVIVVDGHLRRFTIHNAKNGDLIKIIYPHYNTNTKEVDYSVKITDISQPDNGNLSDDDSDRETKPKTQEIQEQSLDWKYVDETSSEKQSKMSPPILIDPFYVHVTDHGNIVVSDIASPNLKFFNPSGMLLSETMDYGTGPDQNLHPSGVVVDSHGFILVADTNNHRIHMGLADGQMTAQPLLCATVDAISHPVCLCLSQDGSLAVAQSGGQVNFYTYVQSSVL